MISRNVSLIIFQSNTFKEVKKNLLVDKFELQCLTRFMESSQTKALLNEC